MDRRTQRLQQSYDRVAHEYTVQIADELAHKPLDRQLLERFAETVRERGLVYDLGCGPGHVTRFLADRGMRITGLDLSEAMVTEAQRRNPGMAFEQADMRALPCADGALAGISAFYSIIHVRRDEIVATLREWRRALQMGGQVLIAFHVGAEVVHLDEWWAHEVDLDFAFFGVDEMRGYLQSAGFVVDQVVERPPYPEVEHQSQRAYVFAHRD